MIEYVLKNQRFKEKESEKNGNNIKLLNIQKINSLIYRNKIYLKLIVFCF